MSRAVISAKILICFVYLLFFVYALECAFFAFERLSNRSDDSLALTYKTQYLHPYYFFFFPTDPKLLKIVNHEAKWIDERGFGGGLGPESKGDRKLAFLIGGSTAFGDKATHPSKSISSHLNKLQDEYFFVNAAVPSWNTFQELLRILKQLLAYKPDLIVSLTGANDVMNGIRRLSVDIPFDSPESFEDLHYWVEKIRAESFRDEAVARYVERQTFWGTFVLFNTRKKLGIVDDSKVDFAPDNKIAEKDTSNLAFKDFLIASADQVATNLEYAQRVSKMYGTKYIAILQPYRGMHPVFVEKLRAQGKRELFAHTYSKITDNLLSRKRDYIKDLRVPFKEMAEKELEEEIYSDDVHFHDLGYEKISVLIWEILQ